MPLASKLEVLGKDELYQLHETTLKILEETGVIFFHEEVQEIFKEHGARVEGDTVYIPRDVANKALGTIPSSLTYMGRNRDFKVTLGGNQRKLAVSTNHGPVYIQDLDHGKRPGTLKDYGNLMKLCQMSDLVDIVGAIPVEPNDIMGVPGRHLYMLYQLLSHTDKPLIGYSVTEQEAKEMFDLIELAYGNKLSEMKNPVIMVGVNPLSPLKFDRKPCETILAYAKAGQVPYISSCVLAGVSAPVSLLGAAVVMNTEIVAGLILTQLINPGCPVVYQTSSTVANVRKGSYITGSPESNFINIIGLQMAQEVYHMPTRAMAGLTDSKSVDIQAGYETMQNILTLVLAGVNHINETLGVLDSIMTTSYEKFIIDAEIVRRAMRVYQGLEGFDRDSTVDLIQSVGHDAKYLMQKHTFKNYKKRWTPTVSEWDSYDDWLKAGSEDILTRANRRYKKLLAQAPDTLLPSDLDRDIRSFVKNLYGDEAEKWLKA